LVCESHLQPAIVKSRFIRVGGLHKTLGGVERASRESLLIAFVCAARVSYRPFSRCRQTMFWAVGYYGTISKPAEPSCSTASQGSHTTDVWAVGAFEYCDENGKVTASARSYHWDGSTWSQVTFR
jgi:hypothetical protein